MIKVPVAVLAFDFLGNLFDVLARITVFRKLHLLAEQLTVARVNRQREIFHLVTGIVDVVFTLDRKPGCFVQARQYIPDHCDSPVTDMQGPGRINAGKFDLNLFSVAEI